MMATKPQPETINRLFNAVYPSFAMLAGMELDLFTPLDAGPLRLEQTRCRTWCAGRQTKAAA